MPRKRSADEEPEYPASGSKKAKKEKVVKEKRCNAFGATVRYRSNPSIKDSDRIDRALSRGLGVLLLSLDVHSESSELRETEVEIASVANKITLRSNHSVIIKAERPGVSHRLFLIDRQVLEPVGSEGGGKEKFVVLGATGNVYDVVISKNPTCSCPDAARGNICKHRFFVMLRVLKLDQSDPIVWQQALLTAEVEKALSSSKACEASALASSAVKDAYIKATGGTPEKAAKSEENGEAAGPPPDDECPICYEDFKSAPEATEQCQTCRKFVHKACMAMWLQSTKKSGGSMLCVLCRSPWKDRESGEAMTVDGYLNLSGNAGAQVPRVRELYAATARWIH